MRIRLVFLIFPPLQCIILLYTHFVINVNDFMCNKVQHALHVHVAMGVYHSALQLAENCDTCVMSTVEPLIKDTPLKISILRIRVLAPNHTFTPY